MSVFKSIWRFAKYPVLIAIGGVLGFVATGGYVFYIGQRDYDRAMALPFAEPEEAQHLSLFGIPSEAKVAEWKAFAQKAGPCVADAVVALRQGKTDLSVCEAMAPHLWWILRDDTPKTLSVDGLMGETKRQFLNSRNLPTQYHLRGLGSEFWAVDVIAKSGMGATKGFSPVEFYQWNSARSAASLGLDQTPDERAKMIECSSLNRSCKVDYTVLFCDNTGVMRRTLSVIFAAEDSDPKLVMKDLMPVAHAVAIDFKTKARNITCTAR